ncbi:MAG TPA: ATP-binding protein [Arcobacter sp.]|nr:ATP-binding protein [Arcobacter sp.]HIP55849.1 ATP-binding protein [Arcobacter sp.]
MRALALFSGGLDSVLAMKIVKDQGLEVVAINIQTGFGSTIDRREHMQNMCDQIGVELKILDLRTEFLDEVLFDPKYGYGKNFNPCIDCHGFMFRYTGQLLEKYDASFMISGEVLGQRPMSQNKDALQNVKNLSEVDDLIVRPLCAKLMPITKPEELGWINRDKLLDISGRSRSRQLELVKEIGLKDFEPPAGGCLLTEIQFSNKLRDFVTNETLEIEDINTLKAGRHLRLPDGAKLIIGRNQEDNENLKKTTSLKYDRGRILEANGPFCLLQKDASPQDKKLAGDIIVTYGRTDFEQEYIIEFEEFQITGKKLDSKEELQKYFV